MGGSLVNGLKGRRIDAGIAQAELARRVGVSRQSISALEGGRAVPATSLALQLAKALHCRVEDIFWLNDGDASFRAVLIPAAATAGAAGANTERRVAVANVDDRWVARILRGGSAGPADALLAEQGAQSSRTGDRNVRPLRDAQSLSQNVFAAGCDPATALLAGHVNERTRGRLHWIETGSASALELLARRRIHMAGLHLFDERTAEYNVAAVKRVFPRKAMLIVNLAIWEQGLAVAKGNPRRIRAISDLGGRGVRLIGREEGTGADELFRRLATKEGFTRTDLKTVGTASSHAAVAQAIALGAADVGITTREAAATYGLELIPLAEARFDFVMRNDDANDPRLQRVLDVIGSERFRRDLGGLTGYGTARTGQIVAELSQ